MRAEPEVTYHRAWFLESPIGITDYEMGAHVLDFVVVHNLRADEEPTDADLPRVDRITRLDRADGQPIGVDPVIPIDLNRLAVDAVARSASVLVRVRVESPGAPSGWMYEPASESNWREVADAIRLALYRYGGRMRWTPDVDKQLITHWRHICEHGCGTARDLALALGTTAPRIHTRLHELRKLGVDLPKGKPGRPAKRGKETQ